MEMAYVFSNHAEERFHERISIPLSDFIDLLENKSVLHFREKDDTEQRVLYIKEQDEFFIVVVRKQYIISVMPCIWRSKGISDHTLDAARVLSGEIKTVLSSDKHKKLPATEVHIRYRNSSHPSTKHFIVRTLLEINAEKIEENINFLESFESFTKKHSINKIDIEEVRVRINGSWTTTNKFYK